jgi:tRNA(Ile2) C34 agmatinyltransferase TiaS
MRNRCFCPRCGDIIESRHRHDFVRCKCGAIFTDGGNDYVRRGMRDGIEPVDIGDDDALAVRLV